MFTSSSEWCVVKGNANVEQSTLNAEHRTGKFVSALVHWVRSVILLVSNVFNAGAEKTIHNHAASLRLLRYNRLSCILLGDLRQNRRAQSSRLAKHVEGQGQQAEWLGLCANLSLPSIQQGRDVAVKPQSESAILFG